MQYWRGIYNRDFTLTGPPVISLTSHLSILTQHSCRKTQIMGCNASKDGLNAVDDSVHVMIKHDKKKQKERGEMPHGYVPRAEHPLMQKSDNNGLVATEDDGVKIPVNGQ